MLCQNCKKNLASVQYTQIINDKKIQVLLCDNCAKASGNLSFGLNINDFFDLIIGGNYFQMPFNGHIGRDLECKNCGMTFDEFQKIGKFGCGNCYKIFEDKVDPIVKRLHGNNKHTGKIPGKMSKVIKASEELRVLKELLEQAIQAEEYEKAASIRDEIKRLEKKE